jgi:hypothetical protein
MGFLESLPLIGGAFDTTDEQLMKLYGGMEDLYQDLPQDSQTYTAFRPGELQYTGDYKPEEVQLQQIATDPKTRGDLLQNLSRMQYLADKGLSAEDELGFANARSEAEQMARGREGAVIQNMQARGQAGSGMEAALRAQAGQEAANRQRQAAMEQAAASARQKALYTQAYGNALSQFRGDDFGEAAQNAGIANQQAMTNVGGRNQAQLRNLGARQDVGQTNLAMQNTAQLRNIDEQNRLAQEKLADKYRRAAGIMGARDMKGQAIAGQGAANAARRRAGGALIGAGAGFLAGGPQGAAIGSTIGGGIG